MIAILAYALGYWITLELDVVIFGRSPDQEDDTRTVMLLALFWPIIAIAWFAGQVVYYLTLACVSIHETFSKE